MKFNASFTTPVSFNNKEYNPMMRAKVEVRQVTKYEGREDIKMSAVCGTDPFGPNGESEDNTFARFSPCGEVSMTINNPALLGKMEPGQKFYVDFTLAE